MLKSRIIPYEIMPNENSNNKYFIIRYWINGPADINTKNF